MVSRRNRRRFYRHRGSGSRTKNPVIVDAELAMGKFSFIYRNSFQKEIDLKHCVPLFSVKTICESAIRALKRDFDVNDSGSIGYSHAGGLKIVVKIPAEMLDFVKSHLLRVGKSESEATAATFNNGIEWYGIVDGLHTHRSLSELEVCAPHAFQDFKWVVTVIEWQPIAVLKAFARMRNMIQSTKIVEMTLYDTIRGLCEIAREKAQLFGDTVECYAKRRGAITQIADEFCGGSKYCRQTTRTLTGAALRIKPAAMSALCQIMTEEDPSLARRITERLSSHRSEEEDVFDARAYKNIISTNTIRGATAFLNADGQDQANVLKKLKIAYEENCFKCFQAPRLNKEVERSLRAHHQVQLMNILMCRERWPEELSDIHRKLFLSSHFDSELDEHDENSDNILPSLVTEYRHRMPLEAGLRWRLYCADRERTRRCEIRASEPSSQESGNSDTIDDGDDDNSASRRNPREQVEEERIPASYDQHRVELCPLEQLKVTSLNLTLERYAITRKPEDDKFHLITGDPTQVQLNGRCNVQVNERQADKCVGMLKQLLHEHGWVFFYIRTTDYTLWEKAFRANGFEPLDYPWLMIRDTDTIQANTSPIPQNIAELLIGARKKDDGSPAFQPLIDTAYKRSVSSRKRKFAIMDCCKEPRRKLKKLNTREPVRSNQRSPEPMAEFLDTFCPQDGNVLDAFAGTLETAIACYMTGRRCVVLESEKLCFDVALQNLKEHAEGYLAEKHFLLTDSPCVGGDNEQVHPQSSSGDTEQYTWTGSSQKGLATNSDISVISDQHESDDCENERDCEEI